MRFMGRLVMVVGCATLLFYCLAGAAEPPTEPVLRIETGRHTAPIRRIATDAGSRWLATASDDKTLRLWDLQKVSIMHTLRPPIDGGNNGKLYSVAMSPDGTYVATGGWNLWDKGSSIYVFKRDGGHLVRNITGLTNVIYELAWSPDGRYLAAGMGGKSGIRVFRGDNFALIGQDRDYGSLVNCLDFDKQGRLVTSSNDGSLRLYKVSPEGLRLLSKKTAPGGKRPIGVRFSPDGKKIAVGFYDAPAVSLLSADSLDFIAAPEVRGIQKDAVLSVVSWSADGSTLFAGGTATAADGKSRIIRAWSQGGRGEFRDIAAAYNTIQDIRPLAGGGVVFSTFDPAWGLLDASGQRTAIFSSTIADFRDIGEGFSLTRDGLCVRFSFEPLGVVRARFNIADRRYVDPTNEAGLIPPRLTAEGIDVKNWSSTRPTLNGQPLRLSDNERSRSLAFAPDGQSFVLGTEWFLRRFDRVGRELWRIEAPGAAWAVNISADGRCVVAAYADGTIRWYRLSDGKQILSFFPHADRKRWVAWTPSGYYDASPGAEDLIGWHINRGTDKVADFFPISRFRGQLYRPDMISIIFNTLDEREALRQANRDAGRPDDGQPHKLQTVLPPVLEILSPKDGAAVSEVHLKLKCSIRTSNDAPVNGFRARVNGQPATITGNVHEMTISIPPQDSVIHLFAENRHGVSVPAILTVSWKGAAPAESKAEFEVKPKLYVLAVGVSDYDNPKYKLGLAAKDAGDFAAALQAQKDKLYREVEIKLLINKKANRDEVLEGLDWLQKQVTSRDIGMLFLAGHGINDATGIYYFMPSNADVGKLKSTAVVFTEIKNTLSNLAGKSLFFVDTCHSGNVLGGGGRRAISSDVTGVINELASAENGVVVFSSSTGRQYSLENPEWGNGAFTKALVEGFRGKANYGKTGRITHKMLDFYISERVKEITGGQQTPVTQAPGGVPDFPIALTGNS